MKHCKMCDECRPLSGFGKNASARDGLRSTCKDCTNRRALERKADPKVRAAQRRYALAYTQRWRAENPEENRRRRRAYDATYRAIHPEVQEAANARRRARKRNAPHEPYSRAEIFARWGGLCCYCDAPAEHLDHVNPISRGGADAAHNLVPACAPCNLSKSAKTLAEWAIA